MLGAETAEFVEGAGCPATSSSVGAEPPAVFSPPKSADAPPPNPETGCDRVYKCVRVCAHIRYRLKLHYYHTVFGLLYTWDQVWSHRYTWPCDKDMCVCACTYAHAHTQTLEARARARTHARTQTQITQNRASKFRVLHTHIHVCVWVISDSKNLIFACRRNVSPPKRLRR
jgi:hypothetical protein